MTDERTLRQIAERYKTPTYLFDEVELRERVSGIRRILNGNKTGHIGLCYSIKANPFLIPALLYTVDRFEVCSPGELSICKRYNVPGSKIIYSGVHKETSDLKEAVDYGVSVITAESIRQYELTDEVVNSLNRPVKMILRLSSGSQFGMSREDLEYILKKNKDNGLIDITGIHYFAGTQRTKLDHQRDELKKISALIKELRKKYHIPLPVFEYGPGLPFPYFGDEAESADTLGPLRELKDDLSALTEDHELTVEMGRFIASSCGYYLTKVVDIKHSGDTNWCILDGGINHVNYYGQMMGMKVPVIKVLKNEENLSGRPSGSEGPGIGTKWTLCGSLCTTGDVLARDIAMDDPSVGDIFVMCNIGAYSVTESLYMFLSHPMPLIVLMNEDRETIVRDRFDTWQLNAADELPFF
ncbi:MAG: alanine racemase [Lachnospiraceae bacterium]|nr:alanine racemase [Lachnospiraceae bacterium]